MINSLSFRIQEVSKCSPMKHFKTRITLFYIAFKVKESPLTIELNAWRNIHYFWPSIRQTVSWSTAQSGRLEIYNTIDQIKKWPSSIKRHPAHSLRAHLQEQETIILDFGEGSHICLIRFRHENDSLRAKSQRQKVYN